MATRRYKNFNPRFNYLNDNASSKYRVKVGTNIHLALEDRQTGQYPNSTRCVISCII